MSLLDLDPLYVLVGVAALILAGIGLTVARRCSRRPMGRAFVKLIGNPKVMKVATQRGLTHPLLMKFTLKMLANLTDPAGGDAMDRIINGLSKVAPKA